MGNEILTCYSVIEINLHLTLMRNYFILNNFNTVRIISIVITITLILILMKLYIVLCVKCNVKYSMFTHIYVYNV